MITSCSECYEVTVGQVTPHFFPRNFHSNNSLLVNLLVLVAIKHYDFILWTSVTGFNIERDMYTLSEIYKVEEKCETSEYPLVLYFSLKRQSLTTLSLQLSLSQSNENRWKVWLNFTWTSFKWMLEICAINLEAVCSKTKAKLVYARVISETLKTEFINKQQKQILETTIDYNWEAVWAWT